ncbi:zinc finger protein 493-like [Daktulosphaira vitifoliae]|uniref:zinc finger protein 493-like n=1 Tax=Daktulosphaira vitifoliae TaxID=58002 RepID=UPI0021AA9CF6|nr:zinc finger protein 493-like [Daktulosphaira vitifoliae]
MDSENCMSDDVFTDSNFLVRMECKQIMDEDYNNFLIKKSQKSLSKSKKSTHTSKRTRTNSYSSLEPKWKRIRHSDSFNNEKNVDEMISEPEQELSGVNFRTSHVYYLRKLRSTERQNSITSDIRYLPRTRSLTVNPRISEYENIGKLACRYCDKIFDSINILNSHEFSHMKNTVFECVECDKIFTEESKLDIHKLWHRTNKKSYKKYKKTKYM